VLWLISTLADLWFGVRQAACSIEDQASVSSRICGFPIAAIRIWSKSGSRPIAEVLFLGAVIPLPFPKVPVLMAAGIMQEARNFWRR